jgi:hypothetical protein
MNFIEFNGKLTSPSHERVLQFPQNSLIFNLLGNSINESELSNISNDGKNVRLDFVNEQCAKLTEERLTAQVVPGVCGAPLYGIVTDRQGSSLILKFVEL